MTQLEQRMLELYGTQTPTANAPQLPSVQPILGQQAPTNQSVTKRFGGVSTAEPSNQSKNLGLALQELLKRAQGMGTANFANQGFNAQQDQTQRQAYTAPGLIGASPSVQAGARSAESSALNPTIQGAKQSAQTFTEQLGSFKEGINSTLDLLKQDQLKQDKERDDARQLVNQALTTFGSKGFDIIDPKLIKLAGYNPDTLNIAKNTLKEQEIERKVSGKTFTTVDLGDAVGFYDSLGNLIKREPKGATPGTTKLTPGMQDDLATMDTVSQLSNQLLQIASSGNLPGVGGLGEGTIKNYLAKNFGVDSGAGQQVRDLVGNIKGTIAKLRGGTSFTPNEQALLDTYTPTINDNDQVIVQKLKDLTAFIQTKKNALITTQGISTNTGGTVQMTGPRGTFNVPANQVTNFEQNGYKRI